MVKNNASGVLIAATMIGYLCSVVLYSFIGLLILDSCIKSAKVHNNKQISDMEILETQINTV